MNDLTGITFTGKITFLDGQQYTLNEKNCRLYEYSKPSRKPMNRELKYTLVLALALGSYMTLGLISCLISVGCT